ncbi:MAG: hypothetical protein H6Q14_832 [Bacteroidetes bacterium]|jgi:hypothetical protein|nr:hypothetical protein [Bacteroidota bacterium]
MKKYLFIAVIVASLIPINRAVAQVHVNINISSQPEWGPSGHDYARYYYIPEINVYYDVTSGLYVYYSRNSWVKRHSLPPRYRHFDLYRAYKVIVNDRNPWNRHATYKRQYARYATMHGKQAPLRDVRRQRPNQGPQAQGGRTENRNHNSSGKQDNRNQKQDNKRNHSKENKQNDRKDTRSDKQQDGRK